jgi:alanine racemase
MLGPYRCWVEISLSRLRDNYRAIRELVGPGVLICPVVKADAYRHGSLMVAQTLAEEGASWFAVSSVEEGMALRRGGIHARILVMADFLPASRAECLRHHLTPVLHSLEDLCEFDRLPGAGAFHLKFDSGMGRLGTNETPEAIADALAALRHAQFEGLMTHFASAADYGSDQTANQIERYEQLLRHLAARGLTPAIEHLSSTIPIAYARSPAWRTLVRPGHAIYGYVSPARGRHPGPALAVRPALSWYASVLTVKPLEPGDPVGYGAIFRAPAPMRIAVISAGYADGLPHRLSGRGTVLVNGIPCPILGAISMDVTTIDISAAGPVAPGDRVTLLNQDLDAQQIARQAGTISYAVLCGISARVKRVYVE